MYIIIYKVFCQVERQKKLVITSEVECRCVICNSFQSLSDSYYLSVSLVGIFTFFLLLYININSFPYMIQSYSLVCYVLISFVLDGFCAEKFYIFM